jgi:putative colanic acid biosynthesis acetyltransferase WcaF
VLVNARLSPELEMPENAVTTGTTRRLGDFTGAGYDKGRPVLAQIAWFATQNLVFGKWWFPLRWRPTVLRFFGGRVGARVRIRHNVRVHWPWKLSIGDDVWIGEDAWILNLEPVTIGHDVCMSQGAMLCTGSHSRSSPTFEFDNAPISLADGSWVAAKAVVLRGVTVHRGAVVGAGAVAVSDVPAGATVLAANDARPGSAPDRRAKP